LAPAREGLAVLVALGRYWFTVIPCVRREIRVWSAAARSIRDPTLRRHALETLEGERLNAEAAAVFGVLVARRRRAAAVRLMVAFQVLTDFIDTVSEQPTEAPLRDSLQLHRSLSSAVSCAPANIDYYAHHPQQDDSGYVAQLVSYCSGALQALPASAVVVPFAAHAAQRCGEGQSHTHAAVTGGPDAFSKWASEQGCEGYEWWEVAAGASSSVAVHALFALAADPRATPVDAALVDAAYFPPIGALTVLLDSLVDRENDAATHSHNYLSYYATNVSAAARLACIVTRAREAVPRLRNQSAHAAILAGVVAFYVSSREADTGFARPVSDAVARRMGGTVTPILRSMRLRRRVRELLLARAARPQAPGGLQADAALGGDRPAGCDLTPEMGVDARRRPGRARAEARPLPPG
jgi:tetraprenyl-beta-curcumene synthase